jgi:hypothetical protein
MKSTNPAARIARAILAITLSTLVIVWLLNSPISASASPIKKSNEPGVNTIGTITTIRSVGEYDGTTVEASEDSGWGSSAHNHYDAVRVGDGPNDEQYRAILSFKTSSLPDNATLISAKLKLKYAGKYGTLPFKTHHGLWVDVNTPAFGSSLDPFGAISLWFSDFEAAATQSLAAQVSPVSVNGWYTANIPVEYISKTKITQFRLRFLKDDNDDLSEDYIAFFEGDYAKTASRPRLVITHYP